VKIINRYVLKEHIGPFVFALSALTSLLLLQVIARKFGDLVGRGLSWQTITEFFLLSFPYTIAMTLPMAVLVAVLYAFSRLASENEVTALKAGGISARSLLKPSLAAATVTAVFMLWFNDQVLSRANHELATLQMAIARTKPTFALKEQVINPVKEGQLYLRAGEIERDQSGRMRDVTIYDVSDAGRRRTIFADSGTLLFASNRRDLVMHLYDGMVMSAPTAQAGQLDRIYYQQDILKIRDVANSFQSIDADTASKGEREMNVCEMQQELELRTAAFQRAYQDSVQAMWRVNKARGKKVGPEPKDTKPKKAGGIGLYYCTFIAKYLHVPAAEAAEVPASMRVAHQDTSKKKPTTPATPSAPAAQQQKQQQPKSDSVMVLLPTGLFKKVPRNKIPAGSFIPETAAAHASPAVPMPKPGAAPPAFVRPTIAPAVGAANAAPTPAATDSTNRANAAASASLAHPLTAEEAAADPNNVAIEVTDAKIRLDDARHWRNRYGVEIQKKFSLAAACIVFVLVGAPIALRFPRGGVGLVMGVGFSVFAIYYVGLIGGEALSDHGIISPFWAMWLDNIIFTIVGLILIARMGNEGVTGRGGNFAEMTDSVRHWFLRRRGSAA
jgi:lipopolysaccharide export system permease protein